MKLTVGPLPSAVYWRRRAVLLGAMLLIFSVLWVSISSVSRSAPSDSGDKRVTTSGSSSAILTPSVDGTDGAPPSGVPAVQTGPVVPAPALPAVPTCTDEDIALTPVAEPNPARRGASVKLSLKIKNISARKCTRDLGAEAQELYIQLDATKVWSSDACNPQHDSSVQHLNADAEVPFFVNWGGKANNAGCDEAKRQPPAPGRYQLFGRLATKISEPVALTLT
ncbi:MAG TPA: hypothetical protein VK453_09110 [Micromonosporaceae bacterium]|nr:hypothetical protein [Micromonosporaceae bacterium]